ncbi:MAG: hypothetical protein ACREB5_09555, partial [Sphingomonadaceae bacterium]
RFEQLAGNARLMLEVTVDDASALSALAAIVAGLRGGRGELVLHARLGGGSEARVRLGREYMLDAELAARIEVLPGILSVALRSTELPRLALVS